MKLLSEEQFNTIQPIIIDTYLNATGGIFSENGYLEILDVLFDYIYYDEISKKAKVKPDKEKVKLIRDIIKDFYVKNLIYNIKIKKQEKERLKKIELPDDLKKIVEYTKKAAEEKTLYDMIDKKDNRIIDEEHYEYEKGLMYDWTIKRGDKYKFLELESAIIAHRYSANNKEDLLKSDKCGCFYCGEIFKPSKIIKWVDNNTTALCPFCIIDSVLAERSMKKLKIDLNDKFLEMMHDLWFEL